MNFWHCISSTYSSNLGALPSSLWSVPWCCRYWCSEISDLLFPFWCCICCKICWWHTRSWILSWKFIDLFLSFLVRIPWTRRAFRGIPGHLLAFWSIWIHRGPTSANNQLKPFDFGAGYWDHLRTVPKVSPKVLVSSPWLQDAVGLSSFWNLLLRTKLELHWSCSTLR